MLPLTAAQQQVMTTLKAAEGVASEIERRRRALRRGDLALAQRADQQAGLLEALERLTNLLGVLSSSFDSLPPESRLSLDAGIADLRQRIFSAGVQVLESKLNAIRGEAEEVLEGRAFYRMGLGDRMRAHLSQLSFTIEGLGGRDGLPDMLQDSLLGAEQSVAHLIAFERKVDLLPDLA
jgi:hypothetical protein